MNHLRLSVIFLLLLAAFAGKAQVLLSGCVLNDSTGRPLAGASVYINNSTTGTVTNDSGQFFLHNLRTGFYDVIASFVGYEPLVYRATIGEQSLKITFRLLPKSTELRNVLVLSKEGRQRRLEIFRENFLGITSLAEDCKILNEEEILFADSKGPRSIRAFSEVPLIVINKGLGYRISFELKDFYFNPGTGQTFFLGYSRYEELAGNDKPVPPRYLKVRARAYQGSTLHFFHALIADSLRAQGFWVIGQLPFKPDSKLSTSKEGKPLTLMMPGEVQARDLLKPDSSHGGQRLYRMDWQEKLEVRFTKEVYGLTRLRTKTFIGGSRNFVSSTVAILEEPVIMDAQGGLENPLAIQFGGYWSYEKVANMLPIDYHP